MGTSAGDTERGDGRLSIALLGPPLVECDGAPLTVDTRKAIALLAYLAMTGQEHRRPRLASLLWAEYDEVRARASLRRTLSVLNKALGGRWLVVDRATAHLESDGVRVDVSEFRAALRTVAAHTHDGSSACSRCLDDLTHAVGLYRDDFLAGFGVRDSPEFDEWQFFHAESLRRDLAGALGSLGRAHAARGDLEDAIACARRRLRLDPLHEPSHQELMRLYAWAGQRGAALRQYRDCVEVLDRELGVAPLEETTELYRAARDDRLPPSRHSPRGDRALAATPRQAHLPLVGRDAELRALLEAYEGRLEEGLLVFLEGEAGIGKTRLAHELVGRIRAAGAHGLVVTCHRDEVGLAYGAVAELLHAARDDPGSDVRLSRAPARHLTEVARLVPDLREHRSLPEASVRDTPGARRRLLEAVAESLCAAVGDDGYLLIDDVQWIDPASLEVVGYLARRLGGRPLCLMLTGRSEDLGLGHPARALVAHAERGVAVMTVTLARLEERDVAELARASLGAGPADDVAATLFRETEGLPFFVVEYLAALASGVGEAWPSGGVRSLLRARTGGVAGSARQVLSAAAVIGRLFDYEIVREVSGRGDEETVAALEALVARGLIREATADPRASLDYDFTHERLRAFVYDELSEARRRLLHGRAADALARRAGGAKDGALHALVARHLRSAGRGPEAAEHFERAGRHAMDLFANAEALSHFEDALALGHPDASRLHEAIGDLRTLLGDYGSALTSYETAAARAPSPRLAGLEHKLGNLHHRRGNWRAARSHFDAALALLVTGDGSGAARVLADRSLTEHHGGDRVAAEESARRALAAAEGAGDEPALAQAHNLLGVLATRRADLNDALAHLGKSLELAGRASDPAGRIAALNNLALVHRASGREEEALALAREALELCARRGDRHREAALHNNVADILHDLGRSEEAMGHLKRSVAILAAMGEPDVLEPEIWKLTQW